MACKRTVRASGLSRCIAMLMLSDHIPDDLWEDDVDGDGYISWEEFSGPKGAGARDEL